MEIGGRSYTDAQGYRYGYQGKYAEKDPETGWNAFELRMYDSRVGRWLSVDPEGQYYSPYVGMGNDPVNGIDPNGGYKSEFWAKVARAVSPDWWGAQIRQSAGMKDWYLTKSFGSDNSTDGDAGVRVTFGNGNQRYDNSTLGSVVDYFYQRSLVSVGGNKSISSIDGGVRFETQATEITESPIDFAVGALPALEKAILTRLSASVVVPRGFHYTKQFVQAGDELVVALEEVGLKYHKIGVRGSSVTGISSKGGGFRWTGKNASDIDVFIEFSDDVAINASKNIPGFIHPNKIMKKFPALDEWSKKWSTILERQITPGGFKAGTFTDPNFILF